MKSAALASSDTAAIRVALGDLLFELGLFLTVRTRGLLSMLVGRFGGGDEGAGLVDFVALEFDFG